MTETTTEKRIEETWARFLSALDAVELSEKQRAHIYNAALDWHAAEIAASDATDTRSRTDE